MTLKEVAKRCLPPIIIDTGKYLLKGKRPFTGVRVQGTVGVGLCAGGLA